MEKDELRSWEKIQIVLKEYDVLRSQILQLIQSRNSIATFGLAAIGVMLLAGMSIFKDSPLLTYITISVIAPCLSIITLVLLMKDTEEIHRIGAYLREIEKKVDKITGNDEIEQIEKKVDGLTISDKNQDSEKWKEISNKQNSPEILLFWENWIHSRRKIYGVLYSFDISAYFFLFFGLSLALQVHALIDRSINPQWIKLGVALIILTVDVLIYYLLVIRLESVGLRIKWWGNKVSNI